MRYFVDFGSVGKRKVSEVLDEEEEKEIEDIFEKKMARYSTNKSPSPLKKRLSRLGRSPFLRSRNENKNKICYQYAAIHMFGAIMDFLGYKRDEFMNKLNLDLIDEAYLENMKPIYLKLLYDPDEEFYEQISPFPIPDVENDVYVIVRSYVDEITDDFISISYYHPNDNINKKKLTIKRDEDTEHIFEYLLQSGSAYNYLETILDVLTTADLISYNIILQVVEDPYNKSTRMGEFINVVGLQTPVKHVVSVIDINGKFELADNNTKHIFNSYDELIKHLETKYEIKNSKDVFIVERDL